jgi:Protein of unknown function (DUF2281)
MTTPTYNTQSLIEKIQSLPTDRIAEVEDFVDFLKTRESVHIAQAAIQDFPVDDLGPWPKDLSLRREDLYRDDER